MLIGAYVRNRPGRRWSGGAFMGIRLPERLRTALPLTFGLASMGLGIKVTHMPAVILTMVLGSC